MIKIAHQKMPVGTFGVVSGWGLTNENNKEASPVLRYTHLPIVDRELCKRIYSTDNPVNDRMLCAGKPFFINNECIQFYYSSP